MPRKYQGSVPTAVDVVAIACRNRCLPLWDWNWYPGAPQYWPCSSESSAKVAAKAHLRHSVLARLDAPGDKAIPAEIIRQIFSFLCLGLEDKWEGRLLGDHLTFDNMNDLIEEQFSYFPSSRLKRTAFDTFCKTIVFSNGSVASPEVIIEGIDAVGTVNQFGDQISNIVNLCFPVQLSYLAEGIENILYDISFGELLDRPRTDAEQAILLQRKMRNLRNVVLEMKEYFYRSYPNYANTDFADTYRHLEELVDGDFASMFAGFLRGLQILTQYGIRIMLQVVWIVIDDAGKESTKWILSSQPLRKSDDIHKVCVALLKPLADGVQQTKERNEYEEAENDRCMSDRPQGREEILETGASF
ncbi:hypothetical protein DOTSEDRAFT_29697 [Dothistroma septosporum NZE10]|uniref:Uncharacterized protein n=1 Tax=Dothistroma septosporum (strain NZE10 / CBS 128990) TaxID=675120 RepID=M2XGA6_DOTSN|nr:hypothetical protein DOTSEDRAFT_29697 [Dothistroma septosporum NZE10]